MTSNGVSTGFRSETVEPMRISDSLKLSIDFLCGKKKTTSQRAKPKEKEQCQPESYLLVGLVVSMVGVYDGPYLLFESSDVVRV